MLCVALASVLLMAHAHMPCLQTCRGSASSMTTYLHEGDEEGEATNYAVLERDAATFHLILDESPQHAASWTKAGSGYLYLLVSDIEAEYAGVKSRGVQIARELRIELWGAKAFNLRDPSGNEVHVEETPPTADRAPGHLPSEER